MKKHISARSIITLLGIILTVISSCSVIDPEVEVFREEQEFVIDADTILREIVEGKDNAFMDASQANKPIPQDAVYWAVNDYLKVAHSLHEIVWNDPLESWSLNGIWLDYDCANFNDGPTEALQIYFHIEPVENQATRLVSRLLIQPQRNQVSAIKQELYPQRDQWQVIDLSQIPISPDRALQLAEQNGGSETRLAVENDCYIHVRLLPDQSDFDGWQVEYVRASDLDPLIEYWIDAQTGELVNTLK